VSIRGLICYIITKPQKGTKFMDKVFIIIAMLAIVGVVISLFSGLLAMTRGTKKDHQTSQKMMQMRVTCQAIAVISLLLAYLAKH
jgi:hypothetical protein